MAASHQKQIARSRNGILLLLVGALLSWIPFIDLLGGFLTFVGAILVIRGRKAFGPIHRRNVKQAIGLFVAGVAFTVVGGFIAIIVALRGTTVSEQAFTAGLRDAILYTLLIGVLGTVVANLASVFFIYALQRKEGRIALWAAYVSTIGIQIAILSAVLPRIPDLASSIAREVYGAGTFDATQMSMAIAGATGYLAWLNVIPAALYATANYLAWSRIAKGEIPAALKILGST